MHAQVEAGLSDLRQAYAELHEQLDGKQEQKPPEEQQRIRQHVSPHSALTLFGPYSYDRPLLRSHAFRMRAAGSPVEFSVLHQMRCHSRAFNVGLCPINNLLAPPEPSREGCCRIPLDSCSATLRLLSWFGVQYQA